ncbi:MAG: hypothetical protein IT427_00360 [Pirellulales bacterium]|nr:hypothetical protein [Pirellulales bacterium]
MKSLFLALAAALTLSAGSGCCLVDHCLGHHCGYGGGCDDCGGQACSYCGPHCGACGCCGGNCSCPPGECGPGGCANCNGTPAVDGNAEEVPAAASPARMSRAKMRPASHTRRGVRPVDYEETIDAGAACDDGSCAHANYVPSCPNCRRCGCACGNCSPWPNCRDGQQAVADQLGGPAGPPCGQVTYPYYTTRGPRDFLRNNPPRIGP